MSFPDPNTADKHGLLCTGGELSAELLIEAYSLGIFPWPQEGMPLLWFSPPHRGILQFKDFHIPKSVKKMMDKNKFQITFDKNFSEVIQACARVPRDGETGTWILPKMIEAYEDFFNQEHVHSVEAWQDGKLVGGLYGVYVKGVFSGESMFFTESGASKICLIAMIEHLRDMGLEWIDIQMVTPVLEHFGGKYTTRTHFLNMLRQAQTINRKWEAPQ